VVLATAVNAREARRHSGSVPRLALGGIGREFAHLRWNIGSALAITQCEAQGCRPPNRVKRLDGSMVEVGPYPASTAVELAAWSNN
jgi:hypothetical protein